MSAWPRWCDGIVNFTTSSQRRSASILPEILSLTSPSAALSAADAS